MKPPYLVTENILKLVVSISERLGEISATHLYKPPTELRKKNRIKTIQSSLEIEGNTLTEEQITALLDDQRVIAPQKDILEVQNAIKVYERLRTFNPNKLKVLKNNLPRKKIISKRIFIKKKFEFKYRRNSFRKKMITRNKIRFKIGRHLIL